MSRTPRSRVWCCCWERCGGVDVPGSDGPGGELCFDCAEKYHPGTPMERDHVPLPEVRQEQLPDGRQASLLPLR